MAKVKPKTAQARTATKPAHKKRGRKGENISIAFKDIPGEPVDFLKFSKKHKISHKVLIQIKRHDPFKDTGKVFIRKVKESGKMMIWRDANQESTY